MTVDFPHRIPYEQFIVASPAKSQVDCLIGLGANTGDPRASLETAIGDLEAIQQVQVTSVSNLHETRPIGGPPNQPLFLNGAVRLTCDLGAESLHDLLVQIERKLGRVRDIRWGPRRIDLDILFFGEKILRKKSLTLPHPRMSFRRFVLAPAAEVASDMVDPHTRLSIGDYVRMLDKRENVGVIRGCTRDEFASFASNEFASCLRPDHQQRRSILSKTCPTLSHHDSLARRPMIAIDVASKSPFVLVDESALREMNMQPKLDVRLGQRFDSPPPTGPYLYHEGGCNSQLAIEVSAAVDAMQET